MSSHTAGGICCAPPHTPVSDVWCPLLPKVGGFRAVPGFLVKYLWLSSDLGSKSGKRVGSGMDSRG